MLSTILIAGINIPVTPSVQLMFSELVADWRLEVTETKTPGEPYFILTDSGQERSLYFALDDFQFPASGALDTDQLTSFFGRFKESLNLYSDVLDVMEIPDEAQASRILVDLQTLEFYPIYFKAIKKGAEKTQTSMSEFDLRLERFLQEASDLLGFDVSATKGNLYWNLTYQVPGSSTSQQYGRINKKTGEIYLPTGNKVRGNLLSSPYFGIDVIDEEGVIPSMTRAKKRMEKILHEE